MSTSRTTVKYTLFNPDINRFFAEDGRLTLLTHVLLLSAFLYGIGIFSALYSIYLEFFCVNATGAVDATASCYIFSQNINLMFMSGRFEGNYSAVPNLIIDSATAEKILVDHYDSINPEYVWLAMVSVPCFLFLACVFFKIRHAGVLSRWKTLWLLQAIYFHLGVLCAAFFIDLYYYSSCKHQGMFVSDGAPVRLVFLFILYNVFIFFHVKSVYQISQYVVTEHPLA